MEFEEISKEIIGVYFEVYNLLGFGFLEKVYEEAMALEFKRRGISFERQVGFDVLYKGDVAGKYVADFIVGDVVVEIKAKCCLDGVDEAQLINYLKGTDRKVGLLFNFGGEKPDFKRKVFGRVE
ncbi:MAG: GxxExxY protein [archaeon]